MKMNTLIIIQLILFSLISCEKKDNENNFPISLNYELLDSLKNAKTSFRYGENIIFSFRMANNTDSILYYEINFMNDDFFKVYKKNGGELNPIGKPYQSINYEYRLGQNLIPAGETYGFILPWIPDSDVNHYPPFFYVLPNKPLDKGEYYTGFSSVFKFFTKNKEIEYVSDLLTFTINFKIE